MLIFPRVKAWHEVPCLYHLSQKYHLLLKAKNGFGFKASRSGDRRRNFYTMTVTTMQTTPKTDSFMAFSVCARRRLGVQVAPPPYPAPP